MTIIIAILVAAAAAGLLLLQWRKAELDRRAAAARTALLDRLVERFGGSAEFVAFLQSDEGRQLFAGRGSETAFARRLLLMAQGAILAGALGAGFLATALTTPADADINFIREAQEAQYWGTMCLALAVGLGIAFWFCQSRARAWNLLPK